MKRDQKSSEQEEIGQKGAEINPYNLPTYLSRFRSLKPEISEKDQNPRRRIDEELDALERGYIYAASYKSMNDPMEGIYAATEKLAEHPNYVDDIEGSFLDEKLSLGIASFAESWDSQLMWSHYAGGFSGICIRYRFSELRKALDNRCSFTRVTYAERPPPVTTAAAKRIDRAKRVLTCKSLPWLYEREWRLFAPSIGPWHYESDRSVSRVLLGANISDEDRAVILRRLDGKFRISPTHIEGYEVYLGVADSDDPA